jgi:hypothetical protein
MMRAALGRMQLALAYATAFLGGCGSEDPAPSVAADSGAGSGGGGSGGSGAAGAGGRAGSAGTSGSPGADAARECNSLDLVGPVIVGQYVQGQAPAARGGTLADGTYDALTFEAFVASQPQPGAPPARLFRQAIAVLDGATRFESADARPLDGGEIVSRTSGELLAFDQNLTFSYTCPQTVAGERLTVSFSASAEQLIVINEGSVATYRRR